MTDVLYIWKGVYMENQQAYTEIQGNQMPVQNPMPAQNPMPVQNPIPAQNPMPAQSQQPGQAGNTYYTQYHRTTHVSVKRYQAFCTATIVYAILTALCLYRNWSSILTPISSILSVLFLCFFIIKHEKLIAVKNDAELTTAQAWKKLGRIMPYFVLMILIGISVCLNADGWVCFFGNLSIYILGICSLMAYFNNVKRWNYGEYIAAFLRAAFSPLEYVGAPFSDGKANKRQKEKKHSALSMYILIGVLIAVPLLVFVINLLSDADPIFEDVIRTIFGTLFSWDIIGFTLFVFLTFLYVYGLIVKMPLRNLNPVFGSSKKYEAPIGITITVSLTAVYLLFSVIQILYLFINHMTLPVGMSYSEYARQGFFQLLVVVVLNVFIVIICSEIFEESKVLKTVLTIMCLCTFIMIASSAMRMFMYIGEYNLTYQRLTGLFLLLLTAFLMAGVLIKLYVRSFPLITFSVFAIFTFYMIFAFARPVHIVTKYNLTHTQQRALDLYYLESLGLDAVPDIYDYVTGADHQKEISVDVEENDIYNTKEYFVWVQDKLDTYDSIRDFNFARYRAEQCADRILE